MGHKTETICMFTIRVMFKICFPPFLFLSSTHAGVCHVYLYSGHLLGVEGGGDMCL